MMIAGSGGAGAHRGSGGDRDRRPLAAPRPAAGARHPGRSGDPGEQSAGGDAQLFGVSRPATVHQEPKSRPCGMLFQAMSMPLTDNLRTDLEEKIVAPLFAGLSAAPPVDGSLPEVVLEHRRRRAQIRIVDALAARGSAHVPPLLHKEVEKLLRNWAAASFTDSFRPAEDLEIRCAREHDLVAARESGDPERLLAVLDKEHRRGVIEQFGRLELRGIQTAHRVLEDLEEVYVPLHLEAPPEEIEDEEGQKLTVLSRERLAVPEILEKHRHLLIVGAPGSGKSTLIAYLATQAAAGRGESALPLILTVRALKNPALTPKNIASHTGCDPDLVSSALSRQAAMLLFDGLDEAPEELRARLIANIHRFVRKYPGIRVVATSRPAGAPGEIETSLHGLQPFRLIDLTREEVDTFIEKWCRAAERSVRKDLAEADQEAEQAAADLKQRLSQSHSVQRIAVNPLLVAILCVVHRFLGRSIPEHRVTLYEKCTDALLYEWDRAKFAEGAAIGTLDAPTKRRLLMGIARKIHSEHAAELSEQSVIAHFAQTLPDLGRPATDAKRIVEEIRDRSGLLIERRPGFFAFSHLTFQEYLCALDVVHSNDIKEVTGYYDQPWWHEVIVLAAGVPGSGAGNIARRLLSKRRDAATFLAAQCLETESDMPLEIREKIERELQRMIPPKTVREARRLGSLGIVVAPVLARSLENQTSVARSLILWALWEIDYDPAIVAITKCLFDRGRAVMRLTAGFGYGIDTVGGLAALILIDKAKTSAAAARAAKEAAVKVPREELIAIQVMVRNDPELLQIAKQIVQVAPREAAPRKRARNTA